MAKSRTRKPSFDTPASAGEADSDATWVYRSDAAAPAPGTQPAAVGSIAADPTVVVPAPVPQPGGAPGQTAAPVMAAVPVAGSDPGVRPAAAVMSEREKDARLLVHRYTTYAAAAGLVPMPLLDMAAIAAVQVAMLSAIADLYRVPFSRDRGRVLVSALLGAVMPTLAGRQVLAMIAKRLTLVGAVLGMVSVSGFAVAATYAIGRVFIAHFESGGTLLDIQLATARQQMVEHMVDAR